MRVNFFHIYTKRIASPGAPSALTSAELWWLHIGPNGGYNDSWIYRWVDLANTREKSEGKQERNKYLG